MLIMRSVCKAVFQSTRSARSATLRSLTRLACGTDFNPRAPRGARLHPFIPNKSAHCISIHALREERDKYTTSKTDKTDNFNPRAPRGARPGRGQRKSANTRFQSTRSARSATGGGCCVRDCLCISIHALREERDWAVTVPQARQYGFQSTRSARSATIDTNCGFPFPAYFNPRAPRGARHTRRALRALQNLYFNPRAPRGARPARRRLLI